MVRIVIAWLIAWGLAWGVAGRLEGGLIDPARLPALQLWLDPNDLGSLELDSEMRVLSWSDKSPNGLVFRPPTLEAAPRWSPNAFGAGRAGLVFDGVDDYLYCPVLDWSSTPSGEFHTLVRWKAFGLENFILSSTDQYADDRYFMFFTINQLGRNRPGIRIRNPVTDPLMNGFIHTGASLPELSVDTDTSLVFRGFGTGGGFSHEIRVNGRRGIVSYNSNVNLLDTWLDDLTHRRNVSLGAFVTRNTVQDFQSFTLGPQLAFGEVLSDARSMEVESFLYGVEYTVPEPATWVLAGFAALAGALWAWRCRVVGD